MRRTPALIVGGGPAGTAAAIVLARADAPHLLVERTRETADALCGGFLSWRTLEALEALGVPPDVLNAEDITHLRLFHGTTRAEAALPAPAKGVSRRHLDTLLLVRAAHEGAAIERGVAVRGIEGDAVRVDGGTIATDALLLATGKHDVRGLPRGDAGDDPAIGLRLRLPAHPSLTRLVGEAIELHLFAGGYAGLNRQEDGGANLCLAVRRSRLQAAGSPAALLQAIGMECPALGERLGFADGGSIDAVANVPYGWRATVGVAGLWRLGDQAAVIPSLAGEGMGIAIASGASAALALLRNGPAGAARWQERFARQTRRPLAIAGLVRAMAERPAAARTLVSMAGAAPLLSTLVARLTRIDHPALTRTPAVTKSLLMEKITLSDAEWQERLTPVQYHVLREAGTERAFSGSLNGNKADGLYRCAACELELFDSADKYDSGSGWPSFTRPMTADAVSDHKDISHGMTRIESRCARCDSHLGHVFPDGPPPTGQRYCMNSVSLEFVARADA